MCFPFLKGHYLSLPGFHYLTLDQYTDFVCFGYSKIKDKIGPYYSILFCSSSPKTAFEALFCFVFFFLIWWSYAKNVGGAQVIDW